MPESDGLIEHVERFLGPIAGGWVEDAEGGHLPFSIARFDARDSGPAFFSTLGLSRHVLQMGSRTTRQELLMAVEGRFATTDIVGVLDGVGEMVMERHDALLRGEVIGPRGPLIERSDLCALYVTAPVVLPDEFALFEGPEPPLTVVAWLVPIGRREADLVNDRGWQWFEDRLAEEQPNLFDLMRSEIALDRSSNLKADR